MSAKWGVAAAIVVAGGFTAWGLRNFKSQPSVSVKGQAEQSVIADRGSWNLTFQNVRATQVEAIQQSLKDRQVVLKHLQSVGFVDAEITMGAPRVDNQSYQGKDQWAVVSAVVLTSTAEKIRRVSSEADQLLKLGVALNSWDAPSYEFTKLNEIKSDLVSKATVEAQKAAQQFAKDSGSHLGKILTATQGYVSFRGEVENQPETAQMRKIARVVVSATYALR